MLQVREKVKLKKPYAVVPLKPRFTSTRPSEYELV